MVAAISPYISGSLNHVMRQIDGGTGGGYIHKMYLDELDRFRKQLPLKTTPAFAILVRTVELDTPTDADVVAAGKGGEGVFAVWREGMAALAYSIKWARIVAVAFENHALSVRPKRLSYKEFEVPALELSHPGLRTGVIAVGVMARTPSTFRQQMAQSTIDQMAAIIAGESDTLTAN